ncbi:MAG: ATP-binding protein, partial [Candidatus Thermoplasmatota archaeon]
AEATGIALPHIPRAVQSLCKERLIEETKDYVEGVERKRYVYRLTGEGAMQASELKSRAEGIIVLVEGKELKLGDVNSYLNTNFSVLQILLNLKDTEFEYRKLLEKRWVNYLDRAPRFRTFFDREKELEEVGNWLTAKAPTIIIIYGIAGIGKTALTLESVSTLKDKRNIFWYNFREYDTIDGFLKELAEFLAQMRKARLRDYVIRERVPNLKEAMKIAVEDLTECVLVFDDFHKTPVANQVLTSLKDLFPKEGLKIVITTRDLPTFYDRSWVVIRKEIGELELKGLPEKACWEWLREEGLELSKEVFKTVYSIIRGHPLSLELMLMRREDLADYPSSVRKYMYEEILSKLNDEERRILQLASLAPKPLPFEAFNTEYEILERLVRRSLLIEVGNMYEVHEALRSFVVAIISPELKLKYEKELEAWIK